TKPATRHRAMRSRAALAIIAGAAALACAGEQQAAPAPRTGTQRMADTLKALYAETVANPQGNPFLSRQRADMIRSMITFGGGATDFDNRFRMAQERLMAG